MLLARKIPCCNIRFFSASIPFPFHCRIGLICSSSTLRNSAFACCKKGKEFHLQQHSTKKFFFQKRSLTSLHLHCIRRNSCMKHGQEIKANGDFTHRERERERERCFTSKALVTARIDVSDSGPSACKLIREGRFHCNICKRKMKNSCPLHCHMVN